MTASIDAVIEALRGLEISLILQSEELQQSFRELIYRASSHEREAFIRLCQVQESFAQTPPPDISPNLSISSDSSNPKSPEGPDILETGPRQQIPQIRKRKRQSVDEPTADSLPQITFRGSESQEILDRLTKRPHTFDGYDNLWTGSLPLYEINGDPTIHKSASSLRLCRIVEAQRRIDKGKEINQRQNLLNAVFLFHEYEFSAYQPIRKHNLPRYDRTWMKKTSLELNVSEGYLQTILRRGRKCRNIINECGPVELLELSEMSNRIWAKFFSNGTIRHVLQIYKEKHPKLYEYRRQQAPNAAMALVRGLQCLGWSLPDLSATSTSVATALFNYIDRKQLGLGYVVATHHPPHLVQNEIQLPYMHAVDGLSLPPRVGHDEPGQFAGETRVQERGRLEELAAAASISDVGNSGSTRKNNSTSCHNEQTPSSFGQPNMTTASNPAIDRGQISQGALALGFSDQSSSKLSASTDHHLGREDNSNSRHQANLLFSVGNQSVTSELHNSGPEQWQNLSSARILPNILPDDANAATPSPSDWRELNTSLPGSPWVFPSTAETTIPGHNCAAAGHGQNMNRCIDQACVGEMNDISSTHDLDALRQSAIPEFCWDDLQVDDDSVGCTDLDLPGDPLGIIASATDLASFFRLSSP